MGEIRDRNLPGKSHYFIRHYITGLLSHITAEKRYSDILFSCSIKWFIDGV